MAKIPLKEYAERVGKTRATCYNKYRRGGFKTAEKIGRDVFVDEDEPFVDERLKSGNWIGWHKGYGEWQRIQRERDATGKK